MFADKVFRLYGYQKEISMLGKNDRFSRVLNREIGGHSSNILDDLFYRIASRQIINTEALTAHIRFERPNPAFHYLRDNMDRLISMAHLIVQSERRKYFDRVSQDH